MAISSLWIGCDLDLAYSGASIASTGAFLNSGTCTWALTTMNNVSLGSGTLSYVADSDGNYTGVIESTVTELLEDGEEYKLIITFNQDSYDDERLFKLFAAYRQAS